MPSSSIVEALDAGRIIRLAWKYQANPSTCPAVARQAYESLQGNPAVSPLVTPRRCHVAGLSISDNVRVRRCEPRFHSAVTRKGDLFNRTRVRKPSALRSTCLFRL